MVERILTEDDVRDIHRYAIANSNRRKSDVDKELANKYGTSVSYMTAVRVGVKWNEIFHEFHETRSGHVSTRIGKSDLTEDDVRAIRKAWDENNGVKSQRKFAEEIGQQYGLSRTGVNQIIKRERWKDVE